MPEQQAVAPRRGREGGRWINERPTSEEFAQWFEHSMKLDEALKHEDYIGGVVLIPAVDERAKQVSGFNAKGEPIIEQRPELSYVPYAKVEARTAYWWDLLDVHEEWLGVVEHVTSPRMPIDFIAEEESREDGSRVVRRQPGALSVLTHQLPQGYSIMSVPVGSGYSHFLCCTIRVSVYDREEYGEKSDRAVPLRTGRGTKQVPLLIGRREPYADPSSMMKAETGAFGRALGFAGIFVIPGSGVATAEDMLEALAQGTTPAEAAPSNAGPDKPAEAPVRTGAEQQADDEEKLRVRARQLWHALSEESPAKAEEFGAWMRQRGHTNLAVKGAALRGVVKKLEKLREEHEQSAQQAPIGEEKGDVPTAPPEPSPEAS